MSILDVGCAPSPIDMWSPTMHWGRGAVGKDRLCVCCEALRVLASPSTRVIWDSAARGRQRARRREQTALDAPGTCVRVCGAPHMAPSADYAARRSRRGARCTRRGSAPPALVCA